MYPRYIALSDRAFEYTYSFEVRVCVSVILDAFWLRFFAFWLR